MKKFLITTLLSLAVLSFVGCADKSAHADGMKSAKCGASGKCGAAKKSTSKCGGSSKCGSK